MNCLRPAEIFPCRNASASCLNIFLSGILMIQKQMQICWHKSFRAYPAKSTCCPIMNPQASPSGVLLMMRLNVFSKHSGRKATLYCSVQAGVRIFQQPVASWQENCLSDCWVQNVAASLLITRACHKFEKNSLSTCNQSVILKMMFFFSLATCLQARINSGEYYGLGRN